MFVWFYFYAKLTSNAFFAGDNQLKKLPRHCYANPLNFASDLPSTLFHYFVTNPTVIAEPEEALFPGVLKSQAQKFGIILSYIKKKYKTIIERDYGISIDDIGVHSLRKCAHSKLNTASTAGPSGAAACLRGGHSMGKKYIILATTTVRKPFWLLCQLRHQKAGVGLCQ